MDPMTEEDTEALADEELEDSDLLPAEDLDDREFVPYRVPRGRWAELLVSEAIKDLLEDEERKRARTRKRKANDLRTFEATVSAVLCDAVYRELTAPGEWITVTFDKGILGCGGRYRAVALNTKFPDIVRALKDRQWLELEVGYHQHPFRKGRPSKRTRVRAGDTLRRCWIDGGGLALDDFDLDDGEEVIVLHRRRKDHKDRGGAVDYQDTEVTDGYRSELRRINSWLRNAPLALDDDFEGGAKVDLGNRRLCRIFNDGTFGRGGRLYGGFWQHMKSEDRLCEITIRGKPVVALDYGQTALRILYGIAGVQPHWTDGYLVPGLEGHRLGVKKLLNAMLNRDTPLSRFPKGIRPLFPFTFNAGRAVSVIEQFHQPVRTHWRPRIGMELMFRESCILIDVLLRLIDRGIVALPVHDAVVVSEEDQEVTREIMLEVFLSHTSIQGEVGGHVVVGTLSSPQLPH